MSVVKITVPDDLYEKAVKMAEAQRVPVDELFVAAFADQMAQWEWLETRAARGSREKFLAALSKVPDVEPEEYDRIE